MPSKKTFERSLRFREVDLTYDRSEVLRGVDFEVPRGGRSRSWERRGRGRLRSEHDPALVRGVRRRDRDRRDRRPAAQDFGPEGPRQHGAAEPLLFSATVRENILYGRLDASEDDVRAAAVAARADGFVQDLPAKYETEVGERGVKLSIGQQQRISIARAFLKDAPILLLDEPTSALDLHAPRPTSWTACRTSWPGVP